MAAEPTKWVLCLDCASTLCASAFDLKKAIELSGGKKGEYGRKKQLFEKLLSLDKKINLNEICAQLELNDVMKSDVAALLSKYSKRTDFKDDINSAHCVAMAIYQVWNHRKQKRSGVKQRLVALSKLNTTKWKEFEADWAKWIEEESPLNRNVKANAKSKQSFADYKGTYILNMQEINVYFEILDNNHSAIFPFSHRSITFGE